MNVFNPEVIVIGGGAIAAGELLLEPAREVVAERALPPIARAVPIVPTRTSATRRGCSARGCWRSRTRVAVSGRLVVCPTPIGNLEDVTLRVLSALREADVVACEDTRRTRVLLDRYGVSATLVSYHEHNERARAAELVERMRDGGDGGAGLGRRHAARLATRATCWCARASRRGLRGRGAAGAVGGARRAGGLGAAGRTLALRGLPAAQEGRAATASSRSRRRVVAFESPRRVPATLAVLAELDPERPVAVCRELTKVHEEVVRGTAAELAERYAGAPPRGEVVLVLGPAPGRRAPATRAGGSTRCGGSSTPAPSRAAAAASWRS